jgi:signal peptidase
MSSTREIISYIAIILIGVIIAQHMNVVVSGSMEPVFYRGDVVVIEKTSFLGLQEVNPNNLNVGNVVIYKATWFNEPVIHRIIYKGYDSNGELYYITKGDHNSVQDPAAVYPEQVEAKVVTTGSSLWIIPKVGYITLWIRGL